MGRVAYVPLLALAALLLALVTGCGEEPSSQREEGPAAKVEAEGSRVTQPRLADGPRPPGIDFALASLAKLDSAIEGTGVGSGQAGELDYTMLWLHYALDRKYRPREPAVVFRAVSELPPAGDDALVGSWEARGTRLRVVDSRVLIIVVERAPGDSETVRGTFERVVHFRQSDRTAQCEVVVSSESAEGRRGEVVVQRRVPGWFSSPILWYRSDQSTVFMFTKTRTLPITKGGVKPRKAEAYVGGIPPSDPRRYLRFDPSNRMALSREYFARIPRRKIPGVPGKLAGDLPGRGG